MEKEKDGITQGPFWKWIGKYNASGTIVSRMNVRCIIGRLQRGLRIRTPISRDRRWPLLL